MSKPSVIDLFAGCGGLSLGLRRAGFDVKAAVEIEPLAAETYRRNHPQVKLLERDVREVTGDDLRRAAQLGGKTLDLLAGCPPCQGFSRTKRRNKRKVRDRRNGLVAHFLRIAREMRPSTILLENVPGLEKDRRFRRMVSDLGGMGYKVAWGLLDAAEFGVPQRRKRLILMASRMSEVTLPKGNGNVRTVRDCIGKLRSPRRTRDKLHQLFLRNTHRIRHLISKIPVDGGSRSALGVRNQLRCHRRFDGFNDVYGRMKWDRVAPTLTGGCFNPSKGRFLHPVQNRPITMREASLLQTFPRSYWFPTAAGVCHAARLIGDALPPLFGEAQGKHMKEAILS